MKRYFFLFLFLLISIYSFSQDDDDERNNQKIVIDDVNFTIKDKNTFSESDLYKIIKTGSTNYFNYDEYLIDIRRIEKFYFDNGYFDAYVDTATSYNDNEVSVEFIITENNPYIIKNLEIYGLENLSPYDSMELFSTEKYAKINDIYSKGGITSEYNRIITYLQNKGYAFASLLETQIEKIQYSSSEKKYFVNVYLTFNLGNKYTFGVTTLNIINNKYKLNFQNILYDLEYEKGDVFSKEALVISENRLNRISVIENTRIILKDIDSVRNIINFEITGSVRNKYEIQPEILGYDIRNSFYGGLGLSFSDKYFFGDSRTFSAKIRALANSIDNYRFEFIIDLFQPHIFKNNKITGNWNLSSVIFSLDLLRIEQIKNRFTFAYELPKYTYFNNLALDWKLSNERIKFKLEIPLDTTGSKLDNPVLNIFNSILGFTAVHSQLDNFQFPTRGTYQSYLIEESGVLSNLIKKLFEISSVSYIKLSFINKAFFPLTNRPDKNVLGTKFLIGNIFEYGDNSQNLVGENGVKIPVGYVPLESKFLAGGSSSVRGWGARRLGAFDTREYGGNFIVEGSFEYRARPFLDYKNIFKDFGYVLFFDYGNLWDDYKKFKIEQLALAIGTGIRYYTIVGPVRFDFGFKLYDYFAPSGMNKWLFKSTANEIFTKKFEIQFGIGNTF